MLGILHTDEKAPTLYEIHIALSEDKIQEASDLLLSYLTHYDVQTPLQETYGNCINILRYVRVVAFSNEIRTAQCNLLTGEVLLGSEFFQTYIRSAEDLLFTLLHERNHYLIRRLKYAQLQGLSAQEQNILEDSYINGPLYRLLQPQFLKPYYENEVGLTTILCPERKPFEKFLEEIDYPPEPRRYLELYHQCMYNTSNKSYNHIDYSDWMRRGRNLALWLRQKNKREGKSDETENYEPLGGIGNASTSTEDSTTSGSESEPTYNGMENDYRNGPTSEDIQQATDQAEELDKKIYSEDIVKGKSDTWSDQREIGRDLQAILVPKLNLEGIDGRLLQETWDTTLEGMATDLNTAVRDISYKIQQISSLLGALISTPALQDTGARAKSVYPYQMHRQDIVMLSAGYVPTSWNYYMERKEEKVPLYVDVSISMCHWYLFIPWIVQHMKNYIGAVYQFSGVNTLLERPPDTQILLTSNTTDFNTVARHVIKNKYKRILVLTDDDGAICKEYKDKLREQRVEVYLFCTGPVNERKKCSWSAIATRKITLVKPPVK